MRSVIIIRLLLFLTFSIFLKLATYSQSFLESFKKYKLEKVSTISNSKTRKSLQEYIKSHIVELDAVFQSYKVKTGFDFNKADTLFLIYIAPAESPFTNDIIIWSTKDTISYKQAIETIKPFKHKSIITYTAFRPIIDNAPGFKVTTERDSLITLVSKRDYNTIIHLGDNQKIEDGSYVNIYVAFKDKRFYKIESCFPRQFTIITRYQKIINP